MAKRDKEIEARMQGMRLIDANALIEEIKKNEFKWLGDEKDKEQCIHLIKRQPTAYDVNAVVESIESLPTRDFLGVAHIPRTAALNRIKRGGNCELS